MTPTHADAPRIRPGDRSAVGTINWLFAQVSGRVTGTTAPNLFLVLGRHRRLAAHYEMLATTIATLRVPPDRPRKARG